MPRVLSYTPKWLSPPAVGTDIFAPTQKKASTGSRSYRPGGPGPYRTIAYRGTEIFVAVGNEIRWADLVSLKEQDELKTPKYPGRGRSNSKGGYDADELDAPPFRILKVAVHNPITRLAVSPDGSMLAIATAQTVHVALLPSSAELSKPDTGPVRPQKDFTIGPTTHVAEASPLCALLWHPLSAKNNCLVTVTESAEVRLWEINEENVYHSSDEPALSLDLSKLAHAKTAEEDVQARPYGKGKRFSGDDLQLSAACFGSDGKICTGWAEMTLYVTTTDGDVYALCPLIPSKWRVGDSVLESLSIEVAAKQRAIGNTSTPEELLLVKQQARWVDDIVEQNIQEVVLSRTREPINVLNRPHKPDTKPRLQGPFAIGDDVLDEDEDITDLFVVSLQLNGRLDDESEDDFLLEDDAVEGLPAAVICLASDQANVHLCLELEGVEPLWLPPAGRGFELSEDMDLSRPLMIFETIKLLDTPSPLTITADVNSAHSFFVTHTQGVVFVSLDWLPSLVSELATPVEKGTAMRLDAFLNTAETLVERLLVIDEVQVAGQAGPVAAAVVLHDSDLGYFLLTAAGDRPFALTFDEPEGERSVYDREAAVNNVSLPEVRPVYCPPQVFNLRTSLQSAVESRLPARRRGLLAEPVVLSPATLDVMTEAHRLLSHETHLLGVAVSDLFRRCERLREELRDQVQRVAEINERVVRLADEGNETPTDSEERKLSSRAKLELRIETTRTKHRQLMARAERLRNRVDFSSQPLSDREQTFAADVERFSGAVKPAGKLLERYENLLRYKAQLVRDAEAEAEQQQKQAQPQTPGEDDRAYTRVPVEVRRAKKKEVDELLDRQEALMEAAREKLERLGVVG